MTAEDIKARLKGFSPAAARTNEALGDHDKNKKFAPPWYELKHFRATLHIEGIQPNAHGIDQLAFRLDPIEVYEEQMGADSSYLYVTMPKNPPGYPTDELNLMVESAGVEDATQLDGLDLELELDYMDHPWMKERNREGGDILSNGVAVPKRCWYYKTVAKYGDTKTPAVAAEPKPENVKKLAEWCVGKTLEEVTNASLARAAIGMGIQSDNALMGLLGDGAEKFLNTSTSNLVLDADNKFTLLPFE